MVSNIKLTQHDTAGMRSFFFIEKVLAPSDSELVELFNKHWI